MKIFKFGGGTLKNADAIGQMTKIVRDQMSGGSGDQDLVVVISAFNKMTSALEELHKEAIQSDNYSIERIKEYHKNILNGLFESPEDIYKEKIGPIVDQMEVVIREVQAYSFDKGYDQLVSFGEILSTTIISEYWKQEGIDHLFLDARKTIKTDNHYREAKVNWEETENRIDNIEHLTTGSPDHLILTQGFIAGTEDGFTTTLGREGSDYTAAIFGNLLNASEVVVWKDVPGVLTADPTEYDDTCKMDEISYLEAVELSYFGAKVIHPNTIKPLHNKSIPLLVKSLYDPDTDGTIILKHAGKAPELPVIINKKNQVLVSIQPRDFSFIVEYALADIFQVLARNHTRINLMQHGAVSISLVFDWNQEKLDAILGELLPKFKVLYNAGLELLTIRHYNASIIQQLTSEKRIYVQQKSRRTARFVLG